MVPLSAQGVTPFAIAAENGRLAVVQFLVARGGIDINDANRDGDTPLCVAACTGRLQVVKYLVKVGADVQRINHDGASACWIACWNGHLPLVRYLSSLDSVDVSQVSECVCVCVRCGAPVPAFADTVLSHSLALVAATPGQRPGLQLRVRRRRQRTHARR